MREWRGTKLELGLRCRAPKQKQQTTPPSWLAGPHFQPPPSLSLTFLCLPSKRPFCFLSSSNHHKPVTISVCLSAASLSSAPGFSFFFVFQTKKILLVFTMPRTSVKRRRREEQEELLAAERSGSGDDLDSSGGNAVSSASGPARNQVRNSSLLPSHFTALGRLTYLGTRHSCQSELLVSIATADVKQPRLTSSGTLRCSKNHSPFNLPTFSLILPSEPR